MARQDKTLASRHTIHNAEFIASVSILHFKSNGKIKINAM
jgi:hypothetical protein